MRFFTNSDAFNFSWEQVTQAFWKKYPNPQSGHVLTEDVVTRYIKNGSLITKRLLTKTNRMPKLGVLLVGKVSTSVKIVEESIVDPVSRTLTTYTRNIGLTNIMQVEEKCIYQADPANPNRTTCLRQVWITSNLSGVSRAVTKIGLERFKTNIHKTTTGFLFVLENLFGTGHLHSERHEIKTLPFYNGARTTYGRVVDAQKGVYKILDADVS